MAQGQGQGRGQRQGNQMAQNTGNNPGGNGGGNNGPPPSPKTFPPLNPRDDNKTDAWGHLPEALRAEMDTYFADKKFMAKHKDQISKYYSSIAAQNRDKGK